MGDVAAELCANWQESLALEGARFQRLHSCETAATLQEAWNTKMLGEFRVFENWFTTPQLEKDRRVCQIVR